MTRWDALTAICGHLRAGLLGGEPQRERHVPWELIIEVASFHYVTPALAWCLRSEKEIPADVRAYFDAIAARNGERNAHMLAGLARIAGHLNAIGIEPLMLKGASLLVDRLYPDPSLRVLGDLDILIPADRSDEAVASLKAAGFGGKPGDVMPPPGHHHLPMLHDPETGVGVELHTHAMSASSDAVIATQWFCQHARSATLRNQRVGMPDPTRNAGHVIFHSEIFHGLYRINKIQLRHLLDLAMIRARHENAIDWDELDRRFCSAGHGEVLATYLAFAEALLGQAAPKLSCGPAKDAMEKLREQESRDSFHSRIERLQEVYETLQNALSDAIASRNHAETHAAQLSASLEAKFAEGDRLSADHQRLAVGHEKLIADYQRLAAGYDQLLTSRSWRWTAPLRMILTAPRRWWPRRR